MKHPIVEIFSQGEEVITGQVTDTNAAWLSQALVDMVFMVSRHTAVGDKLADLVNLLIEISQRADLCICTGGLGPTVDDLTAQAVAQAFDCPLQLDAVALAQLERYFAKRGRTMATSNKKQAYLPKNAQRIDNAWGTAPGFALQYQRCWFVFVPGVPTEMRHLFDEWVKADLQQRFILQPDILMTLKTLGMGESDLQQIFDDFLLPEGVQLSFRATVVEVQVKLLFPAAMLKGDIEQCVTHVAGLIGDAVFSIDKPHQTASSLLSVIAQIMNERRYTLSLLETVSQGLAAAKCVGHTWLTHAQFVGSVDLLLVELDASTVDDFVQNTALFSQSIKQKYATDLVLLQLHSADQLQLDDKESSVTLYNILLTPNGVIKTNCTVSGSITRKQNQAAMRALDLLRRFLQKKCL